MRPLGPLQGTSPALPPPLAGRTFLHHVRPHQHAEVHPCRPVPSSILSLMAWCVFWLGVGRLVCARQSLNSCGARAARSSQREAVVRQRQISEVMHGSWQGWGVLRGIWLRIISSYLGSIAAVMSEAMKPGATALHVMPRGANSRATVFVRPMTPACVGSATQ